MSESPDTNSIPRDECDHRKCPSEGLVWLETEKSAILLCGHHIRALAVDPVTKRMRVVDVDAFWKHTGMPFNVETFWGPEHAFEQVPEVEEETTETEEHDEEEEGEQ